MTTNRFKIDTIYFFFTVSTIMISLMQIFSMIEPAEDAAKDSLSPILRKEY